MSIITTNAARTTALFLHGLPEAVNINRQSRRRFFSRRRQLLHRFVHLGLKVRLPTLLTNSCRHVLNNLELMSPAKVDFDLLLVHPALTKVAVLHPVRFFSCVFSSHFSTPLGRVRMRLQSGSLPHPNNRTRRATAFGQPSPKSNNSRLWDHPDNPRRPRLL